MRALGRSGIVLGLAGAIAVLTGVGAAIALEPGPASPPTLEATSQVNAEPVPVPPPSVAAPTPAPPAPAQRVAPVASSSGSVTVAFTIPPRTFVRLGADGRPVEAMTNTGRPPQPSDQFLLEDSAGQATAADTTTRSTVLAESQRGDWSAAGAWHTLPA